jgi:integrase
LIGPAAREVLAAYEPADLGDYYFTPRRAAEEHRRARAEARKTPRYPSHERRNGAKRSAAPRRAPGPVYNADSYGTAVARACDRAGVRRWHPSQLRHLFATEVRRRHGLDAAQVVLGHARADVTQVYAERDLALAARVALEMG